MIRGKHLTHSAADKPLVPRRSPMNLNLVAECLGCGTQFVVFMPAGALLTCRDCGASQGAECPRCGVVVAFEAERVGDEPVLLMTFDSDGNTAELP
jgi:transcription elongation factor Elf1